MNTLTTPNENLPSSESVTSPHNSSTGQSTALGKSPRLSHRGLTATLIFMCLVPVATILAMWQFLPPVFEGKLEAEVSTEGLPSAEFYAVDYYERPEFEGGVLLIHNASDQDWTHLNIQVNTHYQIYDIEPIPAHTTIRFDLDRFLSRTGARFSLQYNELRSVRIYARRPTKDRATFYHEFETHEEY